MTGRLTLSWVNKDKALVPDGAGSYEWVERDDPRVIEVRLLQQVGRVGDVSGTPEDSLIIQGDSYDALHALSRVPEYAKRYRGKVKLVYIDPPFNTGQAFEHYDDALEHSVWLGMIRERLLVIRELLAPDGTVWVHLDNAESHRARCLMDEIFGPSNYLASVVWQRTSAKSLARTTLGTMHETILVYRRSETADLRTVYLPLEEDYVKSRYGNSDARGQYDTGDLTAGSHRPHLDSGRPWRGFDPSTRKRCWAVPRGPLVEVGLADEAIAKMTMQQKLDALDEAGYIHWPDKLEGFPRYKKYLRKAKGRAIGDLWTDINVINSQAFERTGFSTQKPEGLIQRVLQMGTREGDIILDCFGGSGTTAAVAHKMRRRWITVEISPQNIDEFMWPRLQNVVEGKDPGGITEAVEWAGGGGFRRLLVGPSLYERAGARVLLADWAKGDEFAEAVAAQLGFAYKPDGPFAGVKGRTRLAVVDGAADHGVIKSIISYLEDDERATVVAKAVAPGTEQALRELSPGSRLLKAPRDLLRRGRVVR